MKESNKMKLMKKYIRLLLWIGLFCFVLCACKEEEQKTGETPSLYPSPTDTAETILSSEQETPTPSVNAEPTDIPSVTPTPFATEVPTPTAEPVVTEVPDIPTPTVSPTATPVPTAVPTQPPEPYFENLLVEAAVREAVGNPDRVMMPEDFETVTVLNLSECELTDVSFLSEFVNLQELDLSWNDLSDCTSLPELKHLTKLDLSYNFISEIQVLSSYTELTELSLRANNLEWLTKPTEPTVDVGQGTDAVTAMQPVFAGLTGLRCLDLSYNMLTDVSELTELTGLEYLNLEKNRITDYSAVEFVPELIR